jgi:hypothetical protein
VIEEKEKHALKDKHQSIVHTSGGEEELSHSIYVRIPRYLI